MTASLHTQSSPELEPSTAPAPPGELARRERETSALRHAPSYLRFASLAVLGLVLDLWSKHWAFHSLGQGAEPRVIIPRVLEFQTMLNPGALFGIGGGQTLLFLIASAFALVLVFWMFAQTSARRWSLHFALGAILAGALGNMYDRAVVKLIERPLPRGNYYVYTARAGENDKGVMLAEYPVRDGGARFQMIPIDDGDGGVIIRRLPRGGHLRLEAAPREVGFVRDFIKIPTKIFGDKDLWPWVFNVADMLLVGGVGLLAIHLWRDRKHACGGEQNTVDGANVAA